jgi:hypothetical protein
MRKPFLLFQRRNLKGVSTPCKSSRQLGISDNNVKPSDVLPNRQVLVAQLIKSRELKLKEIEEVEEKETYDVYECESNEGQFHHNEKVSE